MDLRRVTRDVQYLVRGFSIMALGNWGDGPEGGENFEGRRKVEAKGQEMVSWNTVKREW